MKRIIGLLVASVVVVVPSTAGAGGWAVSSMDPLPPVVAGEEASIGFTLLQHGRTPVHEAQWPGAEIGVAVRANKDEWFVPAEMTGGPGHYVARVDVPDGATSMALSVQMRNGLVVQEDWVDVAVAGATTPTSAGSGGGWLPAWTIPVFIVGVLACLVILLVEVRAAPRQRSA